MRLFLLPLVLATRLLIADDAPTLTIAGELPTPLTLSAADLAKLPRTTVKTTANGLETTWEGVWLHELLARAGAPQGSALRGKALASYLIAEAEDGYQVVYSLAELDPAFVDRPVLVADTADGKPLFGAQGRFRLIAPGDKPGARSVRMLKSLTLIRLRK